jgi:hypothetical protein
MRPVLPAEAAGQLGGNAGCRLPAHALPAHTLRLPAPRQDGCSIVVGEEEPAARRRQMEEAAALQRRMQEALIAAQLRDVQRIQAAASKLVV